MEFVSNLNSYIELYLANNKIQIISLLFLFLGGFLASFLPCVYPIYPITVQILKNRSSKKSFSHPLIYIIGFSLTYSFFGILATITGGTFNTILRLSITNFIIGIFLFILGLSSINLLPTYFFNSKQLKKNKESYKETFLFGIGAAFLSSPCVGPIVVSILLKIATTEPEQISFQNYFSSAVKMLFFGLGLSFPFFLIGVIGLSLPKIGKWSKQIQLLIGVFIFYFSYTFFLKAGEISKLEEKEINFLTVLSVLFLIFSYKIQNRKRVRYERMHKSLMVLGLFWTSITLFLYVNLLFEKKLKPQPINLAETFISVPPIEAPPNSNLLVEENENLSWYRNKELTFQIAKREQKKIFIDFYADWCLNCKEFEKLTISNKELNSALSKVILYKVYDTDKEFNEFAEETRFSELKIGLPFFAILDPTGKLLYKTTDYLAIQEMIQALK